MTTTDATQITPGTLVTAIPHKNGQALRPRRGIILGAFSNDASGYLVWFYGAGPARPGETISIAFTSEITVIGDIGDMSERQLANIVKGINGFADSSADGYSLWVKANITRDRKRTARRGY